jgi:hypothetical protein
MADDLHTLMGTHEVQPLPVYKDNSYIEPSAVNNALKGALVEVHFCIQHYRIKNKDADKMSDSFSGQVQQIIILKDGIPKSDNVYKRKNLLDGPFRPKPFTGQPAIAQQILSEPPATAVIPSAIVAASNTHNPSSNIGETDLVPITAPIPVNAIAGPSNTTHGDDRPAHPVDTHRDNRHNSNTGETALAPVTTPVPVNAIAGPSNTTNGSEPPAHSPITAKKTNAKAAKDRRKN